MIILLFQYVFVVGWEKSRHDRGDVQAPQDWRLLGIVALADLRNKRHSLIFVESVFFFILIVNF